MLIFFVVHLLAVAATHFVYVQVREFFDRSARPLAGEATIVRVLVFGAPLFGFLLAWLRVRFRNTLLARRPTGACLECGYNLTGNLSGRCPECGAAIAAV